MLNQDNSFLHRPRETIQCVLIGLCCLWHIEVGLLSVLCFLIFVRWLRYSVGLIVLVGVLLAGWCCLLMEWQAHFTLSFLEIIHTGFVSHLMFWKIVLTQGLSTALKLTYQQDIYYLFGFPLLFAGLLGLTEWIPNSTYEWELKAIQRVSESLFSRKILAILTPKLVRITRRQWPRFVRRLARTRASSKRFMPAPPTMTLRRDVLPASPSNPRLSRALRLRIAFAMLSLSHRSKVT